MMMRCGNVGLNGQGVEFSANVFRFLDLDGMIGEFSHKTKK